jgi:hypothetical protein
MEKMLQLWEEYNDPNVPPDQHPSQRTLSQESGIPQTVLSYWFTEFDKREKQEKERQEKAAAEEKEPKMPVAEESQPRETRQRKSRLITASEGQLAKDTQKNIRARTTATFEQAMHIGDLVVDKYGDLVKIALESGTKLDDFITDVFNWYERKIEYERGTRALEMQLAELRELTAPNYIFKRKSQCILDFARYLAELKKTGAHMDVKQAARALQTDLDRIDSEIYEMFNMKEEQEEELPANTPRRT